MVTEQTVTGHSVTGQTVTGCGNSTGCIMVTGQTVIGRIVVKGQK